MAKTKDTEDVDPMFKEAKMITDKVPTLLISDGAMNFHRAWIDNYEAKNFLWKDTEHIRHIHMKGDKNNNRMERLNGTIRDREVAYRGIKKMKSPLMDSRHSIISLKSMVVLVKELLQNVLGLLLMGLTSGRLIQNASLYSLTS